MIPNIVAIDRKHILALPSDKEIILQDLYKFLFKLTGEFMIRVFLGNELDGIKLNGKDPLVEITELI